MKTPHTQQNTPVFALGAVITQVRCGRYAMRWLQLSLLSWLIWQGPAVDGAQSVARQWNETILNAIRIDIPKPPVHARNLYHLSAAMFDAWAAYDDQAQGVFYQNKATAGDIEAARNEAISYAAYRVLSDRYALARDPAASQQFFDNMMNQLGYDKSNTSIVGDSPAAIGNRIAQQILDATLNDGSNEAANYVDNTGYVPVNFPMVTKYPAVTIPFGSPVVDPNRWQPLFIDAAETQNHITIGTNLQSYIGPHWGAVTTFALGKGGSGPYSWSEIDPGPPPMLNGLGDSDYRASVMQVLGMSNSLDPTQGNGSNLINIGLNVQGNRPLGTQDDQGYSANPITNQTYADNWVKRADYARVLAEYWADGPNSETPPGHWNVIANQVADSPNFSKRLGGVGPELGPLEWDVKTYLALNGATHDAAVAAWGVKREYDYVRPITMIRNMGTYGQSSDPNLPSYHPNGLPLTPDLIEIITAESIAPGGRHYHAYLNANLDAKGNVQQFFTPEEMIDMIVVKAWNYSLDPAQAIGGTDWILAMNWVPFQSEKFVTPAFAAYVSGHSTFSRASAEVLAHITGSPYFPGGVSEKTFQTDYLKFEDGPSAPVTLQWATYYDAADEAGISRLWGGIHVAADDFAGRRMGSQIGIRAYEESLKYFGVPEPPSVGLVMMAVALAAQRGRTLRWWANRSASNR